MNRTLPPLALGLALGSLLALAGCSKQAGPQAGPTANGNVLPGTVSDAMLDTDRSQAQAPLAPVSHSAAAGIDTGALSVATGPAADSSAEPANTELPSDTPATPAILPKPKPAASPKPAAN